MSITQIEGLDTVPELEVAREGQYRLRVTATEDARSKSDDKDMFKITLRIVEGLTDSLPEGVEFKPINDWMIYSDETLDLSDREHKERHNGRLRRISNFIKALGLEVTATPDPTDWIGREATASLGIETSTEYGDKNRVNRWL